MFDKTIVMPSTDRHVSVNKTVIEKRAPTDESVRLLAEMEQAAGDRFISRTPIHLNNGFSAEVIVFKDGYGDCYIYCLRAKINGKECSAKRTIQCFYFKGDDLAKKVVDSISEMVVELVIGGVELPRDVFPRI